MKASSGLSGIQRHTLVYVQPGVGKRWEVVIEGRTNAPQFADRDRALSYAHIWAAVNRPSTVMVYTTDGGVHRACAFDAAGRYGH
jgi:hypothetical protein